MLGVVATLLGDVEGKRTHCLNSFRGKTTDLTIQLPSVLFLLEPYQMINCPLALSAKYNH